MKWTQREALEKMIHVFDEEELGKSTKEIIRRAKEALESPESIVDPKYTRVP